MGDNTISSGGAANDQAAIQNACDPLMDEAIWIVASENSVSVSLLIERLKIGGERAAELIKSMQAALIVAPTGANGSIQILGDLYDTTVRPLVEAAWQGVLNVTAAFANTADQSEISARINAVWSKLDEAVSELCGKLNGEHRHVLQVLFERERERERQFQEYRADHAAFRQTLGAMPMPNEITHDPHSRNQQSIGEMVARTAVRATVWEAVRALFRL
jgi:hypothetical protein